MYIHVHVSYVCMYMYHMYACTCIICMHVHVSYVCMYMYHTYACTCIIRIHVHVCIHMLSETKQTKELPITMICLL